MKNVLFALLVVFTVSCQKDQTFTRSAPIPSKIDSLTTNAEVEAYIRTLDTNLRDFYLADYSKIMTFSRPDSPNTDSITRIYAKQLGINKSIYKTDFNNDGYTDLLLIGGWDNTGGRQNKSYEFYQFNSQIVMNGGKGKSTTYSIARDYNFPFVPQLVETDSLPFLVLHHPQNFDTIYPPRPDTLQVKLVCRLGQLVEYNPKPIKHHRIEKIEFATGNFESRATFQIILNKDDDSWFIALHHNFGPNYNEGTFKADIDGADLKEFADLLNYIDFENLLEDYSIYNTGPASTALRITYDNGKVKEVYNNSGAGTYGLRAIWNKMEELRFSQNWKRTDEPKGMRLPEPERRTRWKA